MKRARPRGPLSPDAEAGLPQGLRLAGPVIAGACRPTSPRASIASCRPATACNDSEVRAASLLRGDAQQLEARRTLPADPARPRPGSPTTIGPAPNSYDGIDGENGAQFPPELSIERPWTRGLAWLPPGAPRPLRYPEAPAARRAALHHRSGRLHQRLRAVLRFGGLGASSTGTSWYGPSARATPST